MTLIGPAVTLAASCRAAATTTAASGRATIGNTITEALSSDVAFSFRAYKLVSGQNVEMVLATGLAYAYGGYSASTDADGNDWEGNPLPAMATWDAILIEAEAANTGVCTVSFSNDQTQLELAPGEKALLLKSITTAAAESIVLTGPAAGNDALVLTVFATAA